MRAVRAETPARELFRDAAFPASDSSLFYNLSTPLAQFREDITWRRPQVQQGLLPGRVLWICFSRRWTPGLAGPRLQAYSEKVIASPENSNEEDRSNRKACLLDVILGFLLKYSPTQSQVVGSCFDIKGLEAVFPAPSHHLSFVGCNSAQSFLALHFALHFF